MAKKTGKIEFRCEKELENDYKLKCISMGSDYRKITIELMRALLDSRLTIVKSNEMKNAEKVFK